jgi:hypothetical protein
VCAMLEVRNAGINRKKVVVEVMEEGEDEG